MAQTNDSSRTSVGLALPVFPFSDEQVAEVAQALRETESSDFGESCEGAARAALGALACVLRVETTPGPAGYPIGSRSIRGTTDTYVVRPDGSWEAE